MALNKLKRLSRDLEAQLGRGFSERNREQMRHYSLGNLGTQDLASDYQLALPTEEQLIKRLEARRRQLDH